MKPRLKLINGVWWCLGLLMVAHGKTPADAFWNWDSGHGHPVAP